MILVRSSPLVELKRLDELSEEERAAFRELESDPDFYGLFFPKPPLSMSVKAVSRETAELFQRLAAPARLDASEDLVDLILDAILEVETGDGFVSGADALHLAGDRDELRVGDLSHKALLYAQDLEASDSQALTVALYLYNRIPLTPFWKARFASHQAILEHVGADGGTLRTMLEREFVVSTPKEANGWMSWTSKAGPQRGTSDVTYKLYVSPRPEHVRAAFEILVRVLSGFPQTQFKIGDSATGLLRPDKMVAYFQTREELDEAVAELRRELAGCDAQGVPFSAALDDAGLLSWGMDPPEADQALQWVGADSWRFWIAKRLGAAMAIGKLARTESAPEPWQFAVARARRHGVDVETWTPSAAIWSGQ